MTELHRRGALSAEEQQSLDNVLQRFRNVWKPGELERWLGWLPEQGSPLRLSMLLGLVCIDLENQGHQGQLPTVESYLLRFPELRDHHSENLLIRSEYQARCQVGLSVDVSELAQRSNRCPEQLQCLLGLPASVVEEDDQATRLIAGHSPEQDEPTTRLVVQPQPQTTPGRQRVASLRREPTRRGLRWFLALIPVFLALLAGGGAVVSVVFNDGEKVIRQRSGEHLTVHKNSAGRRGKTPVGRAALQKKPNPDDKQFGMVWIHLSDPSAEVNLRLDRGGQIQHWEKPFRLRVGTYTLVVTGKRYKTVRKIFTVHRGKTTLVFVRLSERSYKDDIRGQEKR